MKTAVHTQSAKLTTQLCLSLLITGTLLLTVVCLPTTVTKAATIAQIETMTSGSTVSLGNAVITEILSNPTVTPNGVTVNNWAFLVNDGSSGSATGNYSGGPVGGSLEIFVSKANGVTLFGSNTPTVGDTISMSNAKFSPFNGIPELAFATGSTYSRASQNPSYVPPAPNPVTLDQAAALSSTGVGLDFTTLGYYVQLSNILITNPSPTLFAPDGSNEWSYGPVGNSAASPYNTTAGLKPGPGNTSTSSLTAYGYQSSYGGVISSLGGQVIPTGPVDISGILDVFGSGNELIPFAVTPHIFPLPTGSQFWKPSTVGGSGTWNNSSSSWNTAADGSGTNAVYSSSKFTVFGGTQATSNVQIAPGGVTANGIDIASNGYTISGVDSTATLTIGATNTIDAVDTTNPSTVITANITAQLAGSNGVNINGSFYNPGVIKLNPTAGSENFSGDLTLSAGTLEVPALSTLGTAFLGNSTSIGNKLWLNGGGLKIDTAGTYTLYNGVRGTSASILDLPAGSIFNIAGVTSDNTTGGNAPTITMPNAITLNLTDTTSFGENILHGATFGAAAGGGVINPTNTVFNGTPTLGIHYIVSNSTSGTNTVNGSVDFGAYTSNSGDFILSSDSTSTGKLVITGNVYASAQEVYITGSGILDMQGNNSQVNYTGSATGATMAIGGANAAGPTIWIHNTSTLSAGNLDIFNSGTLNNVSGSALAFTTGLSIGASATSGVGATFTGNAMEFQGALSFYKGSSGYEGATFNNTVTFSNGIKDDTSATTLPLGVILRGSGTLNVSNQHGGAMSNVIPLVVTGGLKMNIGLEADGITTVGTGFTALPSIQVEQGTVTTKIASAFGSGVTSLILGDPSFGGGGTFATAGTVQSMKYLDLQALSVIDMGKGGSLSFTASSSTNSATAVLPGSTVAANAWASGAILRVNNWQASDPLKIGTTAGLTTPEKAAIHFQGYLTGSAQAGDGTVTPIGSQVLFLGDANQDAGHHVDASDISAMEAALTNLNGYETAHSFDVADMLDVLDINGDGTFNGADVQAFLTYLKTGHGSTDVVPEPSSIVLGLLGMAGLATIARRRSKQIAA